LEGWGSAIELHPLIRRIATKSALTPRLNHSHHAKIRPKSPANADDHHATQSTNQFVKPINLTKTTS